MMLRPSFEQPRSGTVATETSPSHHDRFPHDDEETQRAPPTSDSTADRLAALLRGSSWVCPADLGLFCHDPRANA